MASCVLGRLNLNAGISECLGWGFAVMIAVAISGGVSGGHVNPAVTVGLASGKKCAWKNVIPYMIAQYIGSFLAAGVVYATYIDAIDVYDGGVRQIPPSENATAQIFATYPQGFASIYTCLLDQVLGTALLLILICAVTDNKNLRVPPHAQPLLIGLAVTAILLSFGHNCGGPLNPARDFAPRLFTAVSGWGVGVFGHRNFEWFWIPIIAPHVGGIVGVWLYRTLIELPFTNYSRLLEDMETPAVADDRKNISDVEEAKEQEQSSVENLSSILVEGEKGNSSDLKINFLDVPKSPLASTSVTGMQQDAKTIGVAQLSRTYSTEQGKTVAADNLISVVVPDQALVSSTAKLASKDDL